MLPTAVRLDTSKLIYATVSVYFTLSIYIQIIFRKYLIITWYSLGHPVHLFFFKWTKTRFSSFAGYVDAYLPAHQLQRQTGGHLQQWWEPDFLAFLTLWCLEKGIGQSWLPAVHSTVDRMCHATSPLPKLSSCTCRGQKTP